MGNHRFMLRNCCLSVITLCSPPKVYFYWVVINLPLHCANGLLKYCCMLNFWKRRKVCHNSSFNHFDQVESRNCSRIFVRVGPDTKYTYEFFLLIRVIVRLTKIMHKLLQDLKILNFKSVSKKERTSGFQFLIIHYFLKMCPILYRYYVHNFGRSDICSAYLVFMASLQKKSWTYSTGQRRWYICWQVSKVRHFFPPQTFPEKC